MKHWDRDQIESMAKELRREYRDGWGLIGRPVQCALVDSYVLKIGLTQSRPAIEKDALRELRLALYRSLRLSDD